jgi:hypothetical protein
MLKHLCRTVRAAICGWPETARLCVILIAATISITVLQVVAHLAG